MQDGSLTLGRRGLFNFREMRSEKGKQSMPGLPRRMTYSDSNMKLSKLRLELLKREEELGSKKE